MSERTLVLETLLCLRTKDKKDPDVLECFSEQVQAGRERCVQGQEDVKCFSNRNSLSLSLTCCHHQKVSEPVEAT